MAGTYKTSGRERLLRFLEAHPDTPYTVDELAQALHAGVSDSAMPARGGKSSLYRQLSELVADGTVRRDREVHERADAHADRHAAAVYRYIPRPDCARHLHLQCMTCGRLLHLDCTLTEGLLSHIQTDHHFLVNMGKSVLYGQCDACARGDGRDGGNGENA